MRENRPYGSEGGEEASASFSTPIEHLEVIALVIM